MVWLKRSALGFAGLVLVVVIVLCLYVMRSFPTLDGVLHTPGLLAPVQVQRDAADVTHIKAESSHDALFALGYTHAQERGWQLEFNRRVMHGELSAVFGEATLETDKLIRTLGILPAAERQLDGLSNEAKAALQAYSDGINAFHAQSGQALSPEFQILRIQPGTWTPQDSVGWALMMALDLGGNWGTEFARLSAAQTLTTEQLWQLLLPYPGEKPAARADLATLYEQWGVYREEAPVATKKVAGRAQSTGVTGQNDAENRSQMALWSNEFARNTGNVEGKGSNNWVVAGSHTASGKPLLANDPHLGLGAPAIWYFAHLQAPGLDTIGATFPGLPFVVLGRTSKVAWGVTNTGPDVQDLYLEQIHPEDPTLYRVPDINGKRAWVSFKTRPEVIQVKGKPDVNIVVRETRHGPVLSDAQKSHGEVLDLKKFVLSLRWSALDADNHTIQAGLDTMAAQSVGDLNKAFANWHSPMQNVVMADVDGKIAYKAAGKVPLRKPGNDIMGLAPAPGWDARYDWDGWIDFARTPQDDGAKGWVSTANQRITPPGYKYFMGQDWGVSYRFDRIEKLLAQTPKHDLASMQKIHSDITSVAAQRLLPFVQKVQSTHALAPAALKELAGFDGAMSADKAAPLIFAAWADELTQGLLTPKLGAARMKALYGKRHFRTAVEGILERNDAWWCAPLSCQDQSAAALGRALDRLQAQYGSNVAAWQWGQAHQALSSHNPFHNVGALAPYFDVTTPTGGDGFTVNVGQYWLNDAKTPFANRHAASMRTVFDLADLENSQFIYQTGQSGLVFSTRYRDMRDQWAQVQYRPLQMRPAAYTHSLTLKP
ncbi:penicillin acylase family protein [Rhodoferax saidenbachensis]|uniref:Penicillin amidase n=1 Tax=Rhodoferax saidenbachensis TaxID=1484693 RepID=A0A1P8KE42_9BURK|nr:penicillin acylase family protein [Rhodoferax saidenbachensis]APW44208.1 penicillin amidase [Rhodoferax saidenbachensis]